MCTAIALETAYFTYVHRGSDPLWFRASAALALILGAFVGAWLWAGHRAEMRAGTAYIGIRRIRLDAAEFQKRQMNLPLPRDELLVLAIRRSNVLQLLPLRGELFIRFFDRSTGIAMMLKVFVAMAVLCSASGHAPAAPATALRRRIGPAATSTPSEGQAKIDVIRNVVIRGTYSENGQSMPAVLARMRPTTSWWAIRCTARMKFEEGYDGSRVGSITAIPASCCARLVPPRPRPRHGLYILGNLVDTRKQGSTVTLGRNGQDRRRDAWQLRVRMLDGFRSRTSSSMHKPSSLLPTQGRKGSRLRRRCSERNALDDYAG